MPMLMQKIFLYLSATILVILLTFFILDFVTITKPATTLGIVTKVTIDTVSRTTKVSGHVEAEESAILSFPRSGTIREILVSEGEEVTEDEIIASLVDDTLIAEYNAALHNLEFLKLTKEDLSSTPRKEARDETAANVAIAEENLKNTKDEHTILVKAAYRSLLNTDLAAEPVNLKNGDTPPIITGNYFCAEEGEYILSVYRSASPIGHSYNLSGLEEGIFTAWSDTPSSLGSCGLQIQFDENETYMSSNWVVSIPNTKGATYVTYYNAYQQALENETNAVKTAELALDLAKKTQIHNNADPTPLSLAQADSKINEAKALLDNLNAQLVNFTVKAPFAGTITDIDMKIGEVADVTKTISLIGDHSYILKAEIPEADIRSIAISTPAIIEFDAAADEIYPGTIEFISPLSTKTNGASYYEARIDLATKPTWIREGLNADILLTTTKKTNVPVLPKHFIKFENANAYILTPTDNGTKKQKIKTGLIGTNGHVEVLNVPVNTVVVQP